MKKIITFIIVILMTMTTFSQNLIIQNYNICDPVIQLNTFYKNMILYKPTIQNNKQVIDYNALNYKMVNYYHNLDLYRNYMNLPYNKYTYKKYGWSYYNGRPEWTYFGKYPRFEIKIK
jgi:hypothetical protein